MRTFIVFQVILYITVCSLATTTAQTCNATLSTFLWESTEELHTKALATSFITKLLDVTLDPSNFGIYVIQDILYFHYVRVNLDISAEKTKDPALKTFLQDRSKSYGQHYDTAAKQWGIKNPNGIMLSEACSHYVNHLHDVATNLDPIYMVTALIPCVKLWPWIGQQIQVEKANFGVYTAWVEANFDPDYKGFKKYEDQIDNSNAIDKNIALKVYTASMQSEVAFFNSVK